MRRFLLIPALILGCTCWVSQSSAAEPETTANEAEFIRVLRDDDNQPLHLETATVRYLFNAGDEELIVDLIGVIHVADKGYYEDLNEQFEQYDSVLYEMVKPDDVEVTDRRGKPSRNPIGMMQSMLPDMLDLSSQLSEVDYGAKNFVHADLSPQEMSEAIRKRGDNGTTVFLKIMLEVFGQAMRQSQAQQQGGGGVNQFDLLGLMSDSNASIKMKRMMAEQFSGMGQGAMLGQTLETILIADRNAAAMEVLGEQINDGTKNMAIFYGAAHMPDFDKRLLAMGFKRGETQWQRAWDMSASSETESETPLQGLLKLFSR